jgi:hypothetical protein
VLVDTQPVAPPIRPGVGAGAGAAATTGPSSFRLVFCRISSFEAPEQAMDKLRYRMRSHSAVSQVEPLLCSGHQSAATPAR